MDSSHTTNTQDIPHVHVFEKHGCTFLFDPSNGMSYELDAVYQAAMQIVLGEDRKVVRKRFPKIKPRTIKSAIDKIYEMQQNGHFRDVHIEAETSYPRKGYTRLHIALSYACNLQCKYCYANSSCSEDSPIHMSQDIMKKTAEFIVDNAERDWLCCTGLTGEPMCHLELIDEFKTILREEGKLKGREQSYQFGLCSNGTMIENIEVAKRFQSEGGWGFSIDGPPEVHDALRVYADGSGSYAEAIHGFNMARANGLEPIIMVNLTALHPDVSDLYFHFFDLGAKNIVVRPIKVKSEEPYAIGNAIEKICKGYDTFVEKLLEMPDAKLLQNLLSLHIDPNFSDYFIRFFYRVIERHFLTRRCPAAGANCLTINTDGQIYNCFQMSGCQQARVGSIWEGIDDTRLAEIAQKTHIANLTPCNKCWARFMCGGGCMYQSYLNNDSLFTPDKAACTLSQHLIELAIWFYVELKKNRPKILAAMPTANRKNWQNSPPVDCYRLAEDSLSAKSSVLTNIKPMTVFSAEKHLKFRLANETDKYQIELRLGWDDEYFFVNITPKDIVFENFVKKIQTLLLYFLFPKTILSSSSSAYLLDLSQIELLYAIKPEINNVSFFQQDDSKAGVSLVLYQGKSLAKSLLYVRQDDCLVQLAWEDIGVETSMLKPESEFGFNLAIVDTEGGQLEMAPDYNACKIKLVAEDVNH